MSEQAAQVAARSAGTIYDSCWWFWYMPGCYSYYFALFNQIPPYLWSAIGIVTAIGVSVLGAAWGIFITGTYDSDFLRLFANGEIAVSVPLSPENVCASPDCNGLRSLSLWTNISHVVASHRSLVGV
jgi:hypothetical protein